MTKRQATGNMDDLEETNRIEKIVETYQTVAAIHAMNAMKGRKIHTAVCATVKVIQHQLAQ
ncbi:hypothetical protein CRE_22127 [Caenorhabditis remanei]|uniref:Uncharacterized protein n=1 Tax=Caenorhabditis remanei TaxID=31234 RepID=E3NHK8_CAERE|nr:hypothetical protein CRE_22127 [Caenorhabditis remanei]